MNNNDEPKDCPVRIVQNMLGRKWSIMILYHLSTQTLRFGELHRLMPNVTETTLTKELRSLEGYKLITRKVYPQVPPKVEYSFTKIGMKFLPVLEALTIWNDQYNEYVNNDKSD